MHGEREKRPAKPVSNLVTKSQTTSQDGIKRIVKGVKCKCKKSWCPRCGLTTAIKRFVEKVSNWDWRYVRHITLTVDPKLYENPEKALKIINGKHHKANLVRNLERTIGINVIDWQWVIEWHR